MITQEKKDDWECGVGVAKYSSLPAYCGVDSRISEKFNWIKIRRGIRLKSRAEAAAEPLHHPSVQHENPSTLQVRPHVAAVLP